MSTETIDREHEPPVGTWVKDRHGAAHQRADNGRWHAGPGSYAFGKWESMWDARGPLVECGPYGADLEPVKRRVECASPYAGYEDAAAYAAKPHCQHDMVMQAIYRFNTDGPGRLIDLRGASFTMTVAADGLSVVVEEV